MTLQEKAKQIAKLLAKEQMNYKYLRDLFKYLRQELAIKIPEKKEHKLPYVPTEEEICKYYDVVWKSRNIGNMLLIKTLLYTGVRVSELVHIKIKDVDLDRYQIHINLGKGKKSRIVPFPQAFKETLALHIQTAKQRTYLFESSHKKPYSDRGVRKILAQYTKKAEIQHSISPHRLRHFLFTWLKKQGIEDTFIQPYSGHESQKSLEIYSKLSIIDAQQKYENVIKNFPI